MDLLSLSRFKKIAETGHLTRAAEQMNIAQPALSRVISKLEYELGTLLFDRSGRQISLNDYGQIVLKYVNIIFQEIDSMKKEIEDKTEKKSQNVNISIYAASKIIPNLVQEFNKKYPYITLKIKQENLHDALARADIIIDSSSTAINPENGIVLLEEEIMIALPINHPLSQKSKIALSDLATLDFICLPKGKGLRKITDEYCNKVGFMPNVVLECDSPEMTREMISVGMGSAFIPEITWGIEASDKVVFKKISKPICKRYINLMYQNSRYIPAASILFRDFTKKYFESLKN